MNRIRKQKNGNARLFENRLERPSYFLETKSVRNLFHGLMFGKIKRKHLLIPAKETRNIWAVDRAIAQSHYCISNDVKAKLSRKFHAETTLLASAFAKPIKIFFRTISQLNVLHFCLRSAFTFIFKLIWKSL